MKWNECPPYGKKLSLQTKFNKLFKSKKGYIMIKTTIPLKKQDRHEEEE